MQRDTRRWLGCLALTVIATTSCNDPYRPQAAALAPVVAKSRASALGNQVHARLPLAARLSAELESRRCGEPLLLRGKMTLAGLSGRFIYRWSDPSTRQKLQKSVDVAMLRPGQGFTFETTATGRSVAEPPDLFVQFLDASGRVLSRPQAAGRCGTVQSPLSASVALDVRAMLDVALQGCARGTAQVAAAGSVALPGLSARILFTSASGTDSKRALASEIVVPLLAAGTRLDLPKQAVSVPAEAEVYVAFVDAHGRALSLEFPLGRCGDLAF